MNDNPRAGGAGAGGGRLETFKTDYHTPAASPGKAISLASRIATAPRESARAGRALARSRCAADDATVRRQRRSVRNIWQAVS